jgi:lipoprotein-anchoring transpeptidase ErfK/SrfK
MTTSSQDRHTEAGLGTATRRAALLGLPLFLAGCAAGGRMRGMPGTGVGSFAFASPAGDWRTIYAAQKDNGHTIEALDFSAIDRQFLRHTVAWAGPEAPGTIIVDPYERFLYYVESPDRATRYGVGVGREGFAWQGRAKVGGKSVAWPTWTPPHEMTLRDKAAAKWAGGMPGGPENPLGARALYLYEGSRDTLYRIHGNNDESSIGKAVSSGCIRMLNHDIVDLHRRATVGTPVIVLG